MYTLVVAHRDDDPIPSAASTPRRDVMAPWQARCIQDGYIAANLRANIQMADLASVMQFGLRRFKRAFKERFGCTPNQYVINLARWR